jgi:chemotaxis family two-component system sensor kinase Cph1
MQAVVEKIFDAEKNNYPDKVIELHLGDLSDAYGDPTMLEQVWQNLISNALKYSSKQELIIVNIDSTVDDETVHYTIKDNGVGFDEKYKDKLFGVFQRLHRSEEFEGTGVGLAIVNRIIQKHSGSIEVSSELGKGTVFTFSLPLLK